VLAAGKKSKILSLQTELWSDGPQPLQEAGGHSVPYENTFLIVGGTKEEV